MHRLFHATGSIKEIIKSNQSLLLHFLLLPLVLHPLLQNLKLRARKLLPLSLKNTLLPHRRPPLTPIAHEHLPRRIPRKTPRVVVCMRDGGDDFQVRRVR